MSAQLLPFYRTAILRYTIQAISEKAAQDTGSSDPYGGESVQNKEMRG